MNQTPWSSASAGVPCILNAGAGSYEIAANHEELDHVFAEQGTSTRILIVRPGDDIRAHARRALGNGRLVVAGGGDGTVNAVAAALIGTDAVLGVLPLGTLNHFAKDMGIPLDLAGAVRTILTGREKTVDAGEVNGQIFLNNSSLGAYPQLLRGRKAEQGRGHSKLLALALAVVAILRHPLPLRVHLRLDGALVRARRTPLLFVGNNRYSMEGTGVRRACSAGHRTTLDLHGARGRAAPAAALGRKGAGAAAAPR